MGLPCRKVCNVTHLLLAIGQDVVRLPFIKNVKYHSPTVGQRKQCDVIAFQKNFQYHSQTGPIGQDVTRLPSENVQHHSPTFVTGQDVIQVRVPSTKMLMSLTNCWL